MTRSTLAGAGLALGVLAATVACGGSGRPGFGLTADAGTGSIGVARDAGGTLNVAVDAGTVQLGRDDAGGGASSGAAHGCDPTCEAAGGQCTNNSCVLHENPGGLTAAAQQALQAGGTADAAFTWLYPYDATVFPRGLLSPTLQFGGAATDGFLVHITYSSMDYVGYFAGAATPRLALPAASWTAITEGALATDSVAVSVTKLAGGSVTGPITEHWTIAQGSMRGQIYYETYGSPLAGGPDSVGIMSIAPGAAAPTVLKKGCGNVCHYASADGSTLVANTVLSFGSASYDLKTGASVIKADPGLAFTYAGLYPDGSFAMTATNYRTWLAGASHLVDTTTGAKIAAPGWDGVVKSAGTVAFSPDGNFLAFIHEDEDQGEGHTLAMMNFASATKTFSSLVDLATDSANTLAWPAFTPDSKSVVYHAGSNVNFETDGGASGNVLLVDVATRAAARLDALDGYLPNGIDTYLPAKDPDLNFAPTVLPEAVGGYFWVVFTSHRSYGNTLPSMDNMDQNGKLWVAALDLSGTPGKDSSHPAFYLDGQESSADNLRGFWVLPPCKTTTSSCSSGDECCTGFCRSASASTPATCVEPTAGSCSNEYEKCTTTSDCCQASSGFQCIGGFCAQPAPK